MAVVVLMVTVIVREVCVMNSSARVTAPRAVNAGKYVHSIISYFLLLLLLLLITIRRIMTHITI